ncbi:hypothetical protein BKA70DRAFT_1264241 [Coprinopsis sp. MPI-PUGE-AT-0042]|nr:hypothetical protein BKA70DRAFT_1264241 [Coprinopsis sp. MPI-PUGE-AT-0042]
MKPGLALSAIVGLLLLVVSVAVIYYVLRGVYHIPPSEPPRAGQPVVHPLVPVTFTSAVVPLGPNNVEDTLTALPLPVVRLIPTSSCIRLSHRYLSLDIQGPTKPRWSLLDNSRRRTPRYFQPSPARRV